MSRILLIENNAADFLNARMDWANYLISKGHTVAALIPSNKGKDFELPTHITFYWYDYQKYRRGIKDWMNYISQFKRVIKIFNPAIIHSYRFHANVINWLANLNNRKKLIFHITGLGVFFSKENMMSFYYRLIIRLLYFGMILRASILIVQNENDCKVISIYGLFSRKVQLVKGSGVNVHKFKRDTVLRTVTRAEMGIEGRETIFIMVTRLLWEKGIRELVEAFSELPHQLWIVGEPDEDNPSGVSASFVNQSNQRENVSFLGYKSDVPALLNAADVFIYPSYYAEGIPRGILEAMSVGLPIITTNMPGCRTTIDGNGLIIEPKSKEAIVAGCKKMLELNWEDLGKKSQMLIQEHYANEVIFDKQYKKILC